jgi:hypothetical protein
MSTRGNTARALGFALSLPSGQRAVFADQQLEVIALFFRKLEKDLFALGILETLAVAFEETMRTAFAPNTNAVGLEIVHALTQQVVRALRKKPVGGPFEEEKRRPGLEQRILIEQPFVTIFERAQVMLFFFREVVENLPPAQILGEAGRARIKLETTTLGSNRDPQRISRKEQFACGAFVSRSFARAARLTGPVDLHDALSRCETTRGRNFFDQCLDIGAEKFVRAIAALADQVKVPRMAIGMFETKPTLTKVDLARDARIDHPLQRAIDGGAADAVIFAFDETDQIVSTEVPLLAEENVDDLVAFAGALGSSGPQPVDVRNGNRHSISYRVARRTDLYVERLAAPAS